MDDFLSQEEKQSIGPSDMSKNNSKWFVQDPCGIACAVCTYIFLIYAEIVVLLVLLPAFPTLSMAPVIIIFTVLMLLSIVSHVKAMLTNPGTVAYEAVTEEEVMARRQDGEDIRYCKKCRSVKPDRAHHCSTCERCIHRMDHHCPWVNNCVGQNNQKYFVQFTLYVMATSVMGLFMSGLFFFLCVKKNFEGCDALLPGPLIFILMIFGVFEGFLFSLFTCIMFCTQVHSIITDETSIESLKKENRKRRRWLDSLIEVFGSSPGLSWLSPFSPPPYTQHQTSMRLLVSV